MDLTYNMLINCYSLIILVIICVSTLQLHEEKALRDKLYMAIVVVAILMLGADALGRFDGLASPSYPLMNAVGNFSLYMLGLFAPSLWLLYVHLHIFNSESRTQKLILPLLGLNLLNLLALILSLSYGWYYRIDQGNIYHRGPVFWLPSAAAVLFILAAEVTAVINRGRMDRRVYLSLTLFAIPPLIGIVLQNLFFGISLTMHGVTLSLLVIFINVQNRSIYTDHLTGVSNRKRLEVYLKKKIGAKSACGRFAAIMLDMDNFKTINDAYGHNMGDKALEDAVSLLKKCVRSDDFIARYGGDEFIIILDISNTADLEAMIDRINKCVAIFNESGRQPYQIRFSMGYTFYDYDAPMKKEEFIRQLDTLMYQNKQSKKTADG